MTESKHNSGRAESAKSDRSFTKRHYIAGEQCLKRLWLTVFEPPAQQPDRAYSLTGDEIREAARLLFPGGVLVTPEPGRHAEAVALTRSLMEDPEVSSIFEAAVAVNGLHVRADILARDGGSWRLIEVKSSTQVKDHHKDDAVFQAFALTAAGVAISDVELLYVNKNYVHATGEILWEQFFSFSSVTNAIAGQLAGVGDRIAVMRTLLDRRDPPEIDPGPHCDRPRSCQFKDRCLARKPVDWVGVLPRLTAQQAAGLRELGVESITSIPTDFPLSTNQVRIRDALTSGRASIAPDLATRLKSFGPPACYMDFEAMAPAIPLYSGTSPYQQLPFQWSMHVMHADGALEHHEFLHDARGDPRRQFVETLLAVVERYDYPVIVYSSFEQSRLAELAKCLPDLGERLAALVTRLRDLLPVVRDGVYLPAFHFSNSIKRVAPALSQGFGYKGIGAIQDGTAAADAYTALARGAVSDPGREDTLRRELLAYCKHDTWAMVLVHRALLRLGVGLD